MALSMAGMIVAPLVIAALLGRWLDARYGSEPWGFLALTLFSFVISITFVIIKSLKAMQEIEQEGKKEKNASRGKHK